MDKITTFYWHKQLLFGIANLYSEKMDNPIARLWVGTALSLLLIFASFSSVLAAWAPADLTIIEIKMTGTETLVLKNTSANPINLSNYLLQYFNKSTPLSFASPTSSQQLPNINLPSGQSVLFNSDNASTCGAAAVINLSFSLSDTSGYLNVAKVTSQADGSLLFTPQDHANWTSSSSGADIVKVPSNTSDPLAVWYRKVDDGTWQQADLNGNCGLLSTLVMPADTPTYIQWSDGEEPPAIMLDSNSNLPIASVPQADVGLAPPQITELLPNPNGSGTDSSDEFIELYNPNNSLFDLSGFKLETGLSTKRLYTFPEGTTIEPKSFKTFYSDDTNLTLSNSGSQAYLIDPLGTEVSRTEVYVSAKDGQAWALANGKWHWTTVATPGKQNIISDSAKAGTQQASSKKVASGNNKSQAKVKSASVSKSTGKDNSPNTSFSSIASKSSPIHIRVLAVIGALVILYAAYEYRHDLANQIYRFRRYRESRRSPGQTS